MEVKLTWLDYMLMKPEKPEPKQILFNVFEPVSVGHTIFQFANIELYTYI